MGGKAMGGTKKRGIAGFKETFSLVLHAAILSRSQILKPLLIIACNVQQRMRVGKLKSKSLLSPAAFENSWCAADSGPLTKVFKVERDPRLRLEAAQISFSGTFRGFPPC
ncbi:hypothetical protein R1flu_008011 [Riccia fluitans]|uniref:Uncharacterized protein n=1 Tax=Riccia fluitans TaxID=41844 RepID=A0ABD1YAG5_9MARC